MAQVNESPEPQRSEPPQPQEFMFMDTGSLRWRMAMRSPIWHPPTDVYDTEDAVIVRVEIAGMNEDDFSIELDGRLLTIRGVRQDNAERRAFYQMEIRFGEFSSEVELPVPVISDKVDAVYSSGILRILLPKAQPRVIPIEE